jgi:hypothetical protein
MRAAGLLLVAGCWSSAQPPPPAPPVPAVATHTCADAAIGLERGTKNLRLPDQELLGPMKTRCLEDAWTAQAIDCFAQMGPDELGHCAGMLDEGDKDKLFTALGGGSGYGDRAELALITAKVAALQTGIPACDSFMVTVGLVLACDYMPIDTRIQLGTDAADWALPSTRLSPDAITRMTQVCDQSRGELEQRAVGAGCKL